jgi:predicted nucleic acid-binding protein
MPVYVDTSALIKRYVHEPQSLAFDAFVSTSDEAFVISPLTLTELESVLQRRLRQGDFDKRYLQRTRLLIGNDLVGALWQVRPFEPRSFDEASRLMRELGMPLATLDALHLASARAFQCDQLATSDRQLARAAAHSGLAIHDFSS